MLARLSRMIGAERGHGRRLGLRVVVGAALGLAYVALDRWLDFRPGVQQGLILALHDVVDLVLPVVIGAIMGMAVHSLRLRAEAVAEERLRAEQLRDHLHRIERDQAVWVVAASLLHELRNPLHSLGLLLDELVDLPEGAADERGALLARARAQHERVTAELGALRSLPASEAPELPRLDLSGLVGKVVGEIGPAVRGGAPRIVVHAAGPVLAGADPTYVQIILENLLENALDALRERGAGGVVEIEVGATDGRAVVRVRDDGAGVAPETARTMFEPLRTTKARGMGLGLAIARALARAMGGDLVLESGSPATFRLELNLP